MQGRNGCILSVNSDRASIAIQEYLVWNLLFSDLVDFRSTILPFDWKWFSWGRENTRVFMSFVRKEFRVLMAIFGFQRYLAALSVVAFCEWVRKVAPFKLDGCCIAFCAWCLLYLFIKYSFWWCDSLVFAYLYFSFSLISQRQNGLILSLFLCI